MAAIRVLHPGEEIMMITNRGIVIRQSGDEIPTQSRTATGVRVQRLDSDDAIVGVTIVSATVDLESEEMSGG